MKPSYYIASRLENVEQVRRLKAILDGWGWRHTYDWTAAGSVQGDAAAIGMVAEKETRGVREADVFVALLPGGRGTHVELGTAIGEAGCTPYVYSENPDKDFGTTRETCAFYHHPWVNQITSWDDLITRLRNFEKEWW